MLVLTRRPSDRILFPKLGIAIHVVRVDGRSVRLGIEAPRDVHVVRHELLTGELAEVGLPLSNLPIGSGSPSANSGIERNHALRNELQTLLLSLHLLQRLVAQEKVEPPEIERRLADVVKRLTKFEAALSGDRAARPAELQVSMACPGLSQGYRPRALLVEDNPNERSLLAGYLESHDYDVAIAADGQDALEYLTSHELPDVVLLDMNMPRIDGAATVHVIRSDPRLAGIKVIAVSGVAPRQTNIPVGRGGVDQWITKPVRPDFLVEQINRELALESMPV
jgi:carbon storage regulator CsrA